MNLLLHKRILAPYLRSCTKLLLLGPSILFCMSFVLLSGNNEAKLDVSPSQPVSTLYWNGSTPTFKNIEDLNPAFLELNSEEIMEQIILDALAKWNQVPGSYVELVLQRNNNVELNSEDLINSIVVEESTNSSSSAFAVPIFENDTIIDCDISISQGETNAKSLAYTITHEIGHCLGLGHAHTNYGAIMGYSRSPSNLRLGADDIAGLIYLYPDPEYDTEALELISCGTIGSKTTAKQRGLFFLFLICPIVITTGHYLRRKRLGQERHKRRAT